MAAGDLLIEIVKRQPDIQPIIDAVIDAGGGIEIAQSSGENLICLG